MSEKAFDYSLVSNEVKEFLNRKENELSGIYTDYSKEVGKVCFEAQQALADYNNEGLFAQWVESVGLKRQRAYEYINIYKYAVRITDNEKLEIFSQQPKSLQVEMSKPSADEKLNNSVFNGDVTTHKKYKELEKKLKQAQSEKEQAKRSEQLVIEQLEREQNKEPEVITQTVERVVVPDDYEDLERKSKKLEGKVFQLNRQLERIREIDSYEAKAESIKQEVEYLNGERQKLKHIFDSAEKLQQLERKFNDFFDTEMAPLKYKPLINDLTNTNGVSRMKEMVNLARAWVEDMDRMLPDENRQIIEAEMVESKN